MGGYVAWLLWFLIHIYFLVGFRRRRFFMLSWMGNFVAFHKGARLITGSPEVRVKRPRQGVRRGAGAKKGAEETKG